MAVIDLVFIGLSDCRRLFWKPKPQVGRAPSPACGGGLGRGNTSQPEIVAPPPCPSPAGGGGNAVAPQCLHQQSLQQLLPLVTAFTPSLSPRCSHHAPALHRGLLERAEHQ